MNVQVLRRNDPTRPLTDPIPDETRGLVFVHRVYAGDYCDPLFGNWFTPPWPRVLLRWTVKRAHFFAWQIPFSFSPGWPTYVWRGYIGFKLYGVDSPAYKNWLPSHDVFDGSQALCFSLRPFQFRRSMEG